MKPLRKLTITMAALLAQLLSVSALADKGPGVSLFPSSVRENIKFTQETAATMETNLQAVIGDLDLQMQAYQESQCEGDVSDPGCTQIKTNIANTFKSMLEQLDDSLPDMERAVTQTNEGLSARLGNEVGRKMTPRDLQKNLLRAASNKTSAKGSTRRSRMSQNFSRYLELVRTNSSTDLTSLAAEIYLDTQQSLEFIQLTKAEIESALVTIELEQFFGDITDEMLGTVSGVKALLFGDTEAVDIIAGPPEDGEEPEFSSPWEL